MTIQGELALAESSLNEVKKMNENKLLFDKDEEKEL